jgi:membrane glycosyltransferase
MEQKQRIKRASIVLKNIRDREPNANQEAMLIRRIIVSGLLSIAFIAIIVYTMPKTILNTTSLLEYATIVALIIFLFVLLFRYFAILIMAYLYVNEYTYKSTEGFFPFVSIIVPVYNEEKVVKNSIKSLLELNYSKL